MTGPHDHSHSDLEPYPVLTGRHTYDSVNAHITGFCLTRKLPRWWLLTLVALSSLVAMMAYSIAILLVRGVGIWGINIPVGWGFAIIHLVWWIGIGHAGTLISAILLLMRQEWRTSINRFAEAMTLFAVACAGLFPLLHLGRIYKVYYMVPYPDTLGLWPQWRSPLEWDVFAISTYGLVSLMFWYVGLIPDLATMRDRARSRLGQQLCGIFSLGWRNSARHWHRYQMTYLLLAGISTPLVVSVHTVVSLDFAAGIVPGWHATIYPPYFVAGAIYAGFAMVLILAIPLRAIYRLQDFITQRHLNNMAKVMLATGLLVLYGYVCEAFFAYYSGNPYERYMAINRAMGPYGWSYWALLLCNGLVLQLLWFARVRKNTRALFAVAVVVSVGMWLERFVIVIVSLHRDFLPSSWHMYYPTIWDWGLYIGTIGFFFFLFMIFIRLLPVISMFEVRELLHHRQYREPAGRTS